MGAITPCVLPPRRLEQNAEKLAQSGFTVFDDKKGGVKSSDALERAAKLSLWGTQARRARGEFLSHSPCQLEVLIQQGHALGLDAAKHPELMWLAEAALTPEMPIGWLHTSIAGAVGGESGVVYYWSTVSPRAVGAPARLALSGVCRAHQSADEMKRRSASRRTTRSRRSGRRRDEGGGGAAGGGEGDDGAC